MVASFWVPGRKKWLIDPEANSILFLLANSSYYSQVLILDCLLFLEGIGDWSNRIARQQGQLGAVKPSPLKGQCVDLSGS